MQRFLAAGLFALAGAAPAVAQGYRYIDDFDYGSPTAVAEQFTDAMASADFVSAYYLLSPEAKDAFYQAIASGNSASLFAGVEKFEVPALIGTRDAEPDVLDDLSLDWARLFDDMLAGATENEQMPFSFAGGAVEVVAETEDGAEAAIDGATDGLRLSLKETEWGEWRVDSIAWNDGTFSPGWSISPEAGAIPAAELPFPRTFIDEIDYSTAEAVADEFIAAMAEGDWYRAYLLLSPAAKQGILAPTQPLQMLLPGIDTADLPGTGLFRPNVARADSLALDTMRDTGVVFDRIMLAGERQGALPFEFNGAELKGIVDNVATVKTPQAPALLSLHMLQMSNGQWRVDQVSWEGSNPSARPWGAGSVADSFRN
ncbi:MAG TPA: hypothetical protein VIL88_14235 [Devosia sp.]|uniref:hypothetical protein n=1 Tax=Devosia sp. TaxID=1871048 RepID=UPI002F9394E8